VPGLIAGATVSAAVHLARARCRRAPGRSPPTSACASSDALSKLDVGTRQSPSVEAELRPLVAGENERQRIAVGLRVAEIDTDPSRVGLELRGKEIDLSSGVFGNNPRTECAGPDGGERQAAGAQVGADRLGQPIEDAHRQVQLAGAVRRLEQHARRPSALRSAYADHTRDLAGPFVACERARTPDVIRAELCTRWACSRRTNRTGELDLMVRVLDRLPESISADLRAGGLPSPPCGPAPIQFVDVFPNTPDRKIDLFRGARVRRADGSCIDFSPDPQTDRYPLALISPASERTISSTLGRADASLTSALMHPRRCAGARLERERPGARLQRARRGALHAHRRAGD